MKQDYEQGKMIYLRKLPGTYYTSTPTMRLFMDRFTNHVYHTCKRYDYY